MSHDNGDALTDDMTSLPSAAHRNPPKVTWMFGVRLSLVDADLSSPAMICDISVSQNQRRVSGPRATAATARFVPLQSHSSKDPRYRPPTAWLQHYCRSQSLLPIFPQLLPERRKASSCETLSGIETLCTRNVACFCSIVSTYVVHPCPRNSPTVRSANLSQECLLIR